NSDHMANDPRVAKSDFEWKKEDLEAYNIEIKSECFLEPDNASLGQLDPDVRRSELPFPTHSIIPSLSDPGQTYLDYLRLANCNNTESRTPLEDFCVHILKLTGFKETFVNIYGAKSIPFHNLSNTTHVSQVQLYLSDTRGFILLLLATQNLLNDSRDVESQIIAQAIAAFRYNNGLRARHGLECLNQMTFPCIIVAHGVRVKFYLVPVTTGLSDAVQRGENPCIPTTVKSMGLADENTIRTKFRGMMGPKYRADALAHFLAFKVVAKTHWSEFLAGLT
ncbi:hypothetical protein H0H92_015510, partial [Tricholoma furcatifolium]